MKRFPSFILTVVSIYCASCNFLGSESGSLEDSIQYYPPTPKTLEKKAFRNLYRSIASFYDSTLNNPLFNGSFLVAKNGAIVFERYQGTIELNGKDTISPNTTFHIASTSKTFTAMAILKLQEQMKLSVNDSVQQYLKSFPYKGITIKMLLNHRSGIPNYGYFLEQIKWPKDKRVTNQDVLDVIGKYKPKLSATPDKRFNYSNTNYVLLALIIEKVSGRNYAAFLENYFFKPLEMEHTKVFSWSDVEKVTPSYKRNGEKEPFTYLDETYGDKNIFSTVRDLLKWDQALYAEQLFEQGTLDSAYAAYSFERPGIHNYGLGWRMFLVPDGNKIVYHNGWWHGNNASFYRVLSDSITIIVLGNRYNEKIYKMKPLIEKLSGIQIAKGEDVSL